MSTVRFVAEELAGFRSFSPDKPGLLLFQPSLSVIVGVNGSGKSTLVETLRYVMTGEMPGGKTDARGHPFINDPGESGAAVRACARVEFIDVHGRRVQVLRAVNLTRKGNTRKLTSEPPVISRHDGAKWTAISNKIQDTNAEISNLLGVSSAILKYVVFCTQEDSYWPMSEPKSLKDKFEDIFESKRYRMLVDAMNKLRKEKEGEIKEIKAQLIHLLFNVEQAAKKRDSLTGMKAQSAQWAAEAEELERKTAPLAERLAAINARLQDLQNLNITKEQLKTKLDGNRRRQADLREVVQDVKLSGEELTLALEQFNEENATKTQNVDRLTQSCNAAKASIDAEAKNSSQLDSAIAHLVARQEMFAKKEAERDTLMASVASKFRIDGFERDLAPFDDVGARRLGEKLERRRRAAESAASAAKEAGERELGGLQTDKDGRNDELSRLETTRELKAAEEKAKTAEATDIRDRLHAVKDIRAKQKKAEEKIGRLDRQISSTREDCDEERLGKELDRLRGEKDDADAQLETLGQKLRRAQAALEDRTKLRMLEEERLAKQKEKDELPTRRLAQLIGTKPNEAALRAELDAAKSGLRTERRDAEAAVSRLQTQLAGETERVAKLKADLKAAEAELREKRAAVSAVAGTAEVAGELERLAEELEELSGKRGRLAGQTALYKAFQAKLKQEQACPLCDRGCNAKENTALAAKVAKELKNLPTEKETLKAIEKAQLRKEELERVRPIDEAATVLSSTTIPALRKDLDDANARHSQLTRQLDNEEESVKGKTRRDDELQTLSDKFVGWDRLCEELRRLASDVEEKRRLIGSAERLDVGEVQASMERVTGERKALETALETGQRRLREHTTTLHQLQGDRIALQEEVVRHRQELQDQDRLAAKLDELEKEARAAADAAADARTAAAPLFDRIARLQSDIDARRKELESEALGKTVAVQEVAEAIASLGRFSTELADYRQGGDAETLDAKRAEQCQLRQRVKAAEEELDVLSGHLSAAQDVVRHASTRQRELTDALELCRLGEEGRGLEAQLGEVRRRLGAFADRDVERDRQRLQHQIDGYGRERSLIDEFRI